MVRIHNLSVESSEGFRAVKFDVNVIAVSETIAVQRAKAKIRRRFPASINNVEVGTVKKMDSGTISSYMIEIAVPVSSINADIPFSAVLEEFKDLL